MPGEKKTCQIEQHTQVKRMKDAGVCIVASKREGLMHHKFAIIDSDILLTGSFNWTERAASENCENLVISRWDNHNDHLFKNNNL